MAVFNPAIKKTFTVKVAGGKFVIDNVTAPILSIQRDHLYVFNQNDSSNAGSDAAGSHQLYFSRTQDGKHTIDIGVEYGKEFRHGVSYWLDGVRQFNLAAYVASFHLASTREVRIIVPDDAPYKLYPVCWNHSNMYNTNYFHIGSASSNTTFALNTLLDAIDAKVDTAPAADLPQLAKGLNNVKDTINPDSDYAQQPEDMSGDVGPDVVTWDRQPEFIYWGSRHHHSFDGGGAIVYDSNLEAWSQTKYIGWCCFVGSSSMGSNWYNHNWSSHPVHYSGNSYHYTRTDHHVCGCYCWITGTDWTGELGNAALNIGESGLYSRYYSHESLFRVTENMNIQSWEVRDNRVYVSQKSEQLKLRNRFMVGHNTGDQPISIKNIPVGGFGGMSSYNRKRKEVAVCQRTSLNVDDYGQTRYSRYNANSFEGFDNDIWGNGNGAYHQAQTWNNWRTKIYPDVPEINASTNLAKVMDDRKTKTFFWKYNSGDGWYSHSKMALCDNGDILTVVAASHNNYTLARLKRSKNDKFQVYQQEGTQMAYNNRIWHGNEGGWDSDGNHGHGSGIRVVMSRNKRNVVMYGPWYNYGAGSMGWIVVRDSAKAFGQIMYNKNHHHGVIVMPFRDSDFIIQHSHNIDEEYGAGATRVAYQDGYGNMVPYTMGDRLDSNTHSTNYAVMARLDHDGLTY